MFLKKQNIFINQDINNKKAAIDFVGKILVDNNYANNNYIESMHLRDNNFSVYVGNYLAIAHGQENSHKFINRTGMCIVHTKNPINWNDNPVHFIIGLAAMGNDHLNILQNIAINYTDLNKVEALIKSPNIEEIYKLAIESN